ncbi:MAG TPA: hypothetical protein VGO96_12475 [Pyrinomonadaceae bacterium]|jgi:hypothetical protein|nr:hypothetical protein [Pyrinomonadaceae bacterium]
MKSSWNKLWRLSALLMLALTSGCREQIVIQEGDLKEWFLSRTGWLVVVSIVLGALVAKLLCRLQINAPQLDCINAARTRFITWLLALVLVVTPLFLWLDAWFAQPFGEGNVLGSLAVLSVAILNWRTLGLMALVGVVFYLTVAVFTRYFFRHTCNCKYAFIPKFR